MVNFNFFVVVVTFLAATASGAPIKKRINQNIVDSTSKWQIACVKAGGNFGTVCNPQAIKSFDALLANAGDCDQQDQAEAMMKLARDNFKNDAQMIFFTQIYAQQPRNSPSSKSVPYCQQEPKDEALKKLFPCQFAGVDPNTFVGGIPVGKLGTIPSSRTTKVEPPGSCPAHPSGPIPNGEELFNHVEIHDFSKSSAGSSTARPSKLDVVTSTSSNTSSGSGSSSDTSSGSSSTSGDFHLENGKQAQQLNAKFAKLDPNSPCTAADGDACSGSQFLQCVNGKFVSASCGALGCFALPLVNKRGVAVTCTTEADAKARIAATGAQGGITGF